MVHFRKKDQKRGGPREVWQKIILFRNFFRNPSLFLRSLPNVFTHPPQGFVRFGTTKGKIQVGKGDFQGDLGRFWGVWKSATQPTHIWEKPPPEQRFFLRLPFNIQLPSCSCMVQLKDNKSMQFRRWFFENSSWISLSQFLSQKDTNFHCLPSSVWESNASLQKDRRDGFSDLFHMQNYLHMQICQDISTIVLDPKYSKCFGTKCGQLAMDKCSLKRKGI